MNKKYENYSLIPKTLLAPDVELSVDADTERSDKEKAHLLEETFKSFGIGAKVIDIVHGNTVTRFVLTSETGTKASRIAGLHDELMMATAASSLRIEVPVRGENSFYIELPNDHRVPVSLRGMVETDEYLNSSPLTVALGRDVLGNPLYCDIAKMPHLLIAGSVASGKSICLHSLITSILVHSSPEDVRFILIDTKIYEFCSFNGIPHLLMPVINDTGKAVNALKWAITEMRRRNELFAKEQVRDIKNYNEKYRSGTGEHLPNLLIVIDEFAELIMDYKEEMEESISRIAALGRAAGIHLIMATQRPTCEVITGVIKANIGSRIAFAVLTIWDSRSIIDEPGAEQLLGLGDMLYHPLTVPRPIRAQGVWVTEEEEDRIVDYLKKTYGAMYDEDIVKVIDRKNKDD